MHEVEELFPERICKTRVWLSEEARDGIAEYTRKKEKHRGAFLTKLERYAAAGFLPYEGENKPVRHEGGGAYRVSDGELFRLLGFYETDARQAFIGIDTLQKHGQKLSAADRAKVEYVAKVKREGLWRRKPPDGNDTGSLEGTAAV